MRISREISVETEDCVIALGCFDGVHAGHRAVLFAASEVADRMRLPLKVFTFEQPPKNFFLPHSTPLITPTEKKLELLGEAGVSHTYCLPLSGEIFSVPAEEFVEDVLIKRLRASHVVCGFNYTFGAGGAGNTELLRLICERHGVGVSIVDVYEDSGIAVSSSLIREKIIEGDMESAARYLTRPYSITSRVVDGQHLARRLGFPTLNLIPDKDILLPKNGVYVTRIPLDGGLRYGITNVGIRPTVDTRVLCAETHIFDFEGDLYGKDITVEFLSFIRAEVRFDSVEDMAEQVRKDILTAREYIKKIEN